MAEPKRTAVTFWGVVLFLGLFSSFPVLAQEKHDIVFLFKDRDSCVYKENGIYHVYGLHFKKVDKSILKKGKMDTLKNKIISVDTFKREEEKRTGFFYDKNYTYYLLIEGEEPQSDFLIKVKRMLIIEDDGEIED